MVEVLGGVNGISRLGKIIDPDGLVGKDGYDIGTEEVVLATQRTGERLADDLARGVYVSRVLGDEDGLGALLLPLWIALCLA